jgi:putative protease
MDVQIAKVTHYYDKIGVAVVDVTKRALKVGDVVKISGHDNEFNQKVTSLQVEHAAVSKIPAKKSGALKTDKPVKEGDVIYLVTK